MVPLETDNPFWRFSLRVYDAPDVAAECLELQDKLGLDVNVVLFAVWLGAIRGIVLEPSDLDRIDAVVAVWFADVVQALRAVRRRLKLMPAIADREVQALRKQVAGTELHSEQIEQALLFRAADGIGRAAPTPGEVAARANLAVVFGARGADRVAFPLHKLLGASMEARAARD